MGILIKNGTVITAESSDLADVLIEDETIKQIGPDLDLAGHQLIDAAGKLLLPGGIDVHTHLELPVSNTVSSDDFFSGTRAAAFGGTTTHIDFAIQPKGGSLNDGLAIWHQKAGGHASIDYSFHANVTDPHDGIYDEIPDLPEQGITSIKVLMAYKGTFQVDDTALFKVMDIAQKHGILVMVHCENGDVIAQLLKRLHGQGKTAPIHHLSAHPEAAETEATCRAASIAGITGATAYIVHITCARAVEQLTIARAKGYRVMGETCVQYLALTEDALKARPDDPFWGAKYVCSPPLRTKEDTLGLLQSLADDRLQVVSTDHCPFFYDGGHNGLPPGKELGLSDFAKIPNGLPAIEDRMTVTWQLAVNSGLISPNRFVSITSTNPAKIFGLYPQKGAIAVGSDADIVIWDLDNSRKISADSHHMNTDYNPFEGLEVQGWPETVLLRGQPIVTDNRWLGKEGDGRFVHRNIGDFL